MDPEKASAPPSYRAIDTPLSLRASRGPRRIRRSRGIRWFGLACVAFIAYAQWAQLSRDGSRQSTKNAAGLSFRKLEDDLAVCAKLRHKPEDPIGAGRERNGRWIDGQKPTLIRNATVWVGEPAEGTSEADARAGNGYAWIQTDVFLQFGLIQKVERDISVSTLPQNTITWDAKGRQLTSGIIDMHSHAGVDSLPSLDGNVDYSELDVDITPYVRTIDGIQPFDHQLQVIKSGGVTTSLILPGSGNNMGGEAFLIKHAVGPRDGRKEVSVTDMLADPDRTWRYMKMACGENPKRLFGKMGEHGPTSRLGESWEFRHAFEQAAQLVQAQNDWCNTAEVKGVASMNSYLPQELKWESLGAVLRGQVHVNTHCYTIPDLEAFVDHTNEFRFPVRAFHHAHQTYLVPEILKRAWGDSPPASALFADNMYYKAEAYVASEYAGKVLWDNGLTPIYVSDNPVLNAQHVVFEAGKAYHYGLPYHVALAAVTSAPAERLGLGQRLGKVKSGFDADIVVWDSDPLSVGAAPVQVWIDGMAQFEEPFELKKVQEAPIVPNEQLVKENELNGSVANVVFTGVKRVLLDGHETVEQSNSEVTVVISAGKIVCVGTCAQELRVAKVEGTQIVSLANGYLTHAFTAFGSYLGLNEITAEKDTDNGPGEVFSRGVDGLMLDTKKIDIAHRYGVTRAISAPMLGRWAGNHYGTSCGFLTGARSRLEEGAVFADDAAVHYTLSLAAKRGKTPSISSAVGALRSALLEAVAANSSNADPYSEQAYLTKVVQGKLPLVLDIHSADAIAAALTLKSTIEKAISEKTRTPVDYKSSKLRLVILGGAESHLVAKELAAAGVGVVLSPLQSYRQSWDQRRGLTGAPLTNVTAVDVLVDAGVVTAIGLEEDWLIRDMGFLAGIAFKNSEGRLTERAALDLVSRNIYKMLGVEDKAATQAAKDHFLVFEGSPLEVGFRVRAVGGGLGKTMLLS